MSKKGFVEVATRPTLEEVATCLANIRANGLRPVDVQHMLHLTPGSMTRWAQGARWPRYATWVLLKNLELSKVAISDLDRYVSKRRNHYDCAFAPSPYEIATLIELAGTTGGEVENRLFLGNGAVSKWRRGYKIGYSTWILLFLFCVDESEFQELTWLAESNTVGEGLSWIHSDRALSRASD